MSDPDLKRLAVKMVEADAAVAAAERRPTKTRAQRANEKAAAETAAFRKKTGIDKRLEASAKARADAQAEKDQLAEVGRQAIARAQAIGYLNRAGHLFQEASDDWEFSDDGDLVFAKAAEFNALVAQALDTGGVDEALLFEFAEAIGDPEAVVAAAREHWESTEGALMIEKEQRDKEQLEQLSSTAEEVAAWHAEMLKANSHLPQHEVEATALELFEQARAAAPGRTLTPEETKAALLTAYHVVDTKMDVITKAMRDEEVWRAEADLAKLDEDSKNAAGEVVRRSDGLPARAPVDVAARLAAVNWQEVMEKAATPSPVETAAQLAQWANEELPDLEDEARAKFNREQAELAKHVADLKAENDREPEPTTFADLLTDDEGLAGDIAIGRAAVAAAKARAEGIPATDQAVEAAAAEAADGEE